MRRGIVKYGPVCVEKPQDDWGRLEQILGMSEDEFATEFKEGDESAFWGDESEDESEDEYIPEESEDEGGEEEEGE